MRKLIGVEMRLPDGKLPGFYSQIVKGIADRAELFDRHKELLIFRSREELPAVLDLLAHYKVESDLLDLLLLPENGIRRGPRYEDYIVETNQENRYAVLSEVRFFELTAERPEAETAPALAQLEEELIVRLEPPGIRLLAVDAQSEEWAERVAEAYRCGVRWHRFEN
jgi:hypothetical protein